MTWRAFKQLSTEEHDLDEAGKALIRRGKMLVIARSMRRVREILRLKHECGASDRAIGRSLGIARSTVALTLDRVAAAGLAWPLSATLSDRVLEALLYADAGSRQGVRRKAEPDWTHVHRELRRPGVTLMLLWEEYRAREPGGYGYSRWCDLYRTWEGRLSPTMRQVHPAGERLFVDYAGQTVEVVDGRTGEVRQAQVFVAAMGASSYTYAEATWTQTLPDWIGSHTRALAFFGGVPAQLVPDNPRVGVDRANWYEPGLNRTYLDLATHYGTAILPARVRRPRDKAKVEVAVLVVERWILARLRHRRFFSLAELNEAMALLVTDLNARPMRRLGVSRRDLFLELDHPALKPLPAQAYEYAEWRLRRVSLDYHVDIDGHYYSVPYRLIRDQVEARLTTRTVEIFHKGERVAVHLRGTGRGRHTTVPDHMPSAHRRHAEWTIERIQRTAARIGPSTARLLSIILESRPHPEQGYRACLGILRLARQYGEPRLEAACERGLDIGARSYGSIQSILKNGLDRQPRRPSRQGELALPDHPNIRGPHYYH
jgi:transposase